MWSFRSYSWTDGQATALEISKRPVNAVSPRWRSPACARGHVVVSGIQGRDPLRCASFGHMSVYVGCETKAHG